MMWSDTHWSNAHWSNAHWLASALALSGCANAEMHRKPAPTPSETAPPVAMPTTPPTTESPRTLVDVPFLEGMPTDNRVGDPTMELDTISWFFEDSMTGDTGTHVKKAAFATSPAGPNALYFPASENAHGVTFGVRFKIPTHAYDASLWAATTMGTTQRGFTAGVITFDAGGTGQPRYVDLSPDAASAVDVAGIHWVPYRASITPDIVAGWGYLYGVTDGAHDYWIGAPLVQANPKSGNHAIASGRGLQSSEARFVARAVAARPQPRLPHDGFGTRGVGSEARALR